MALSAKIGISSMSSVRAKTFVLPSRNPSGDAQKKTIPVVQPPAPWGDPIRRLLEPRVHAGGAPYSRAKAWGPGWTAGLLPPWQEPAWSLCESGAAFWATPGQWSRSQRGPLRGCWNWEKYCVPKAGSGLVHWEIPVSLQPADTVLLRGPRTAGQVGGLGVQGPGVVKLCPEAHMQPIPQMDGWMENARVFRDIWIRS